MRPVIVLAMVTGLLGVVACEKTDPYGDLPAPTTGGSTASTTPSTTACVEPTAGKDPTTLPECTGTKGTKGRCQARAELGSFKDRFEQASCAADAACVPAEVVKDGSKIQLTSCTAVLNSEGRCFWPLAKDIVDNYQLLKDATKDQCAADQVCAPCVDPRSNQPTGVCTVGAATSSGTCNKDAGAAQAPAPTAPGKGLKECCGGRARCVPTDVVPEDSRDILAADSCTGDAPLCAPNELIPLPGATPKQCHTGFGLIAGLCLPKCAIESAFENFVKGDCADDELCAPCRMLPAGTAACAK